MSPEEIVALRKELSCTAKELAGALGLEAATITGWERGELFPTKAWIERMEALRARGPSAIPRKKKAASPTPWAALADPELWSLLRKLLAHPELRKAATKLAETYDDPAD